MINPVVDRWVQYKNDFKNQDLQEGINLCELTIHTLLPDQTYFLRVRYRDKGLKWSEWSHSIGFSKWHLFPNPTTSTLRVNIPLDHQEHLNVMLYNQKGKLVQTIGHVQY